MTMPNDQETSQFAYIANQLVMDPTLLDQVKKRTYLRFEKPVAPKTRRRARAVTKDAQPS